MYNAQRSGTVIVDTTYPYEDKRANITENTTTRLCYISRTLNKAYQGMGIHLMERLQPRCGDRLSMNCIHSPEDLSGTIRRKYIWLQKVGREILTISLNWLVRLMNFKNGLDTLINYISILTRWPERIMNLSIHSTWPVRSYWQWRWILGTAST